MAASNRKLQPHALITGAAGGLGSALVAQLAESGYRLSVCDRDAQGLERLQAQCVAMGALALARQVDASDQEAISAFVEQAASIQPLDLVIAAAGVTENFEPAHPTFDQAVLAINYGGVVHTVFAAARAMKTAGGGQIVLISSMSALHGFPRRPQYAASKAAVRIFGESIRLWLHDEKIDLTIVSPGFFESGMTQQGRSSPWLMTARKAARLALKGIRKRKAEVIFPLSLFLLIKLFGWLPLPLAVRIYRRIFS